MLFKRFAGKEALVLAVAIGYSYLGGAVVTDEVVGCVRGAGEVVLRL